MDAATLQDQASQLATMAAKLLEEAENLANQTTQLVDVGSVASNMDFLSLFTIFVLACFVGFYVVIVGGLLAAGPEDLHFSKIMGFVAVTLASVNIFGGFIVTQRMLAMFKKKK